MPKRVGRIDAPDWFPAAYQAFLESGSYDEGRVLAACEAAQVAILRELLGSPPDGQPWTLGYLCSRIVRRIDELEAGGGQTEVRGDQGDDDFDWSESAAEDATWD